MAELDELANPWDQSPGTYVGIWPNGVRIMRLNVDGEILFAGEQRTHKEDFQW